MGVEIRRARSAEHSVGEVSDRAAAAGSVQDHACRGEDERVRAGDGDGPAHQFKAREVVDVVAEIGDARERDAVLGGPLAQRGGLVVDALPYVDPQLAGSRGDDRVGLGGEDQHGDAGAPQPRDAHPVGSADPHQLAAVGLQQRRVVGVDAVEVRDDGGDIDRDPHPGGTAARSPGRGQLLFGVDLDRRALRDFDESDTAEEPVACGAEAGGIHHVEGAGLEIVGLAVLASRSDARVVVHAVRDARRRRAPTGSRTSRPRRRHCRRRSADEVDRRVQVATVDEG